MSVPPFTQHSYTLFDFFSQPGRGFYIPYYQRPFSWDEQNAEKLISDLTSSLNKIVHTPNHAMFLGTIILFEEKQPQIGVQLDFPRLATGISNVIDGQQRISSLGMLACVLREQLNESCEKLLTAPVQSDEIVGLINNIKNNEVEIMDFFSFDCRKIDADPVRKPKIIRAENSVLNHRVDQWTHRGAPETYYHSDVAKILAENIKTFGLQETKSAARSVLTKFRKDLAAVRKQTDLDLGISLGECSEKLDSPLKGFLSVPTSTNALNVLAPTVLQDVLEAIYLLAFSAFLKCGCHIVAIDCENESLAFDMFQALNATGTPLTAFEVFKPRLVNCWGTQYSTELLPFVTRAEKVFNLDNSASGKETITDRVIRSVAMVFSGKNMNSRFSDQRDWLIEQLPGGVTPNGKRLVISIAYQAEYYRHFIKPKRSIKDSTQFSLITHLIGIGVPVIEADMAALCVYFLRDAKHQMAHYLLSVYYSALLEVQNTPNLIAQKASEFVGACKAVACFYVLWVGADTGKFPDDEYRSLFDRNRPNNISILTGQTNQTATYLKACLREILETKNILVNGDLALSKANWVAQAKNTAWYNRREVTKFALFAAFHDGVPDTTTGNEGLMTGLTGSTPFLNCTKWHHKSVYVIEHVATRKKPTVIKFPNQIDHRIYPGNKSQVDRIGNLALLSLGENSSVYSEWPDKVFFYWHLTMPSATVQGPTANELQQKLGIINLPPSLNRLQAASTYASHLAPLVMRGIASKPWDAAFIEQRSIHLCERIFEQLKSWIF
jgi:Protein of unknown function DUF262